MTNFVAALPFAAGSPARGTRRRLLASLIAIGSLFVFVLAFAAPARAVVTEVAGTTLGLQPRDVATVQEGTRAFQEEHGFEGELATEAASFANPAGNPVMHASDVYVIYWDPGNLYHKEWQSLINHFVHNAGAESGKDNVFTLATQYRDKTNAGARYALAYKGSYTDIHAYPGPGCTDPKALTVGAVTCLTDAQLREELEFFITSHGLPRGLNTLYYVLTPPGVTLCVTAGHCSDFTRSKEEEKEEEFKSVSYEDSFCSYHADINPGGLPTGDANTVVYAAVPWTAGTFGDGTLAPGLPGLECQDGGFDPTSKPIELREHPREVNAEEAKAFGEMTKEEKEEFLFKLGLEGPRQQEPNQGGVSEEGFHETGLADLIINQIAVEEQNAITDPLLNAWQDKAHNEDTDECRNFFETGNITGSSAAEEESRAGTLTNQSIGGGSYYLNDGFNLAAAREGKGHQCLGGIDLVPRFTVPNPVNAGEVVGFDGMESNVTLGSAFSFATGTPQTTYPVFTWNFGDGTSTSGYAPGAPLCEAPWLSPCAGSIFHSYQYGGTYTVTLTIVDTGGNVAAFSEPVTVVGPPPPTGPGSGSGASGKGRSFPAPLAAAAIVSRSLKKALHNGLTVRYSVNEQVAGHFEVLLSAATARKLHIGGDRATGLPSGTPAQIVIAKAILVTTSGGHHSMVIKLAKKTAARLGHLKKASLLLRLVVRNASTQTPASVSVLSKVTLSH